MDATVLLQRTARTPPTPGPFLTITHQEENNHGRHRTTSTYNRNLTYTRPLPDRPIMFSIT